jgi:hypothetical protein
MPDQPTSKKLTVDDPVDADTLAQFNKLEATRYELASQLLELEQDRVRLLSAAHRVDEQRQRTFERVLVDRGLPPNAQVEVDSNTGRLKVLTPTKSEPDKQESA